jgi:hypothetical protein
MLSLTILLPGCACALFQLDCNSSAADKSPVTVVPQLSSAGLLKAAVRLSRGRLYALLTNGHVHVWELHVTRPPAFLVSPGCRHRQGGNMEDEVVLLVLLNAKV